jgi:hypothetical protein
VLVDEPDAPPIPLAVLLEVVLEDVVSDAGSSSPHAALPERPSVTETSAVARRNCKEERKHTIRPP